MPFEVKWYVEGRVSAVRNWGELTLEEMRAADRILLEHVRGGTPPVHLLIDMRQITKLPGTFVTMLKEIAVFRYEANIGWTILITNNALMPYFGDLSANLTKLPFTSVENYEEANTLLRRVDPTLDDLLPDQWGRETI